MSVNNYFFSFSFYQQNNNCYNSKFNMNKIKTTTNSSYLNNSSEIYNKILEEETQQPLTYHEQAQESSKHEEVDNHTVQMVIDFGENGSSSLLIGQFDDAATLAKIFCFKNNLNPQVIGSLTANIRNLQKSYFHKMNDSSYKIQRNNSNSNKENVNQSNYSHKDNKSIKKNSTLGMSRSKTGQSSVNESTVLSNSRSGMDSNSMRSNVFERLYYASNRNNPQNQTGYLKMVKQSDTSLNTTSNKSLNESSISSCLHVYDKNTKLREASRKHNEYLKELKKQKEVQECNFMPQINPLSNIIAQKLRGQDQYRVYQSVKVRQIVKIKEYLMKKEEEQMKECTFQPKILTKPKDPLPQSKRFLHLHEDHEAREVRKKMASQQTLKRQEQMHRPAINTVSRMIVNKNFEQRLQEDTRKRVNKKVSQEKIKQERLSVEKRPSTGRPPANRNLGDKTIGQYLYEKAKASRVLSIKEEPRVLTNPKSQQIRAQIKHTAFQYLFELLDSDRDGLISCRKINITALKANILRLLAPLLSQMQQVDVELNQQQFIIALDRLFSTLNVTQKNQILKTYKDENANSRVSEQLSFHPTINEKSLMIARQLCQQDTDIYEQSCLRMKERENKLSRMRAERMLQEYSECSFHPRIHR